MNDYQLDVYKKIIKYKGGCGNNSTGGCSACEKELFTKICNPLTSVCRTPNEMPTIEMPTMRYRYAITRLNETDNEDLIFEALL